MICFFPSETIERDQNVFIFVIFKKGKNYVRFHDTLHRLIYAFLILIICTSFNIKILIKSKYLRENCQIQVHVNVDAFCWSSVISLSLYLCDSKNSATIISS